MEHVPAVANVSISSMVQYQPECSCGWKGWKCASKSLAQSEALTHVQGVRSGNVENDPRLS